ncbi:hypothetical protein [Shewanella sp. Shew256]|uniref:hypothetical protein n=1 Tax=Shewanella sp. Shew256 TaxID=1969376 RepID=UPI001595B4F1|nr:hypothetical protein [Shewanella sp. Shew256]
MKKFIEDTLLMLLGALITMLIIGLGELPTLSSEESPDDLQINHQIRVEAHLVA